KLHGGQHLAWTYYQPRGPKFQNDYEVDSQNALYNDRAPSGALFGIEAPIRSQYDMGNANKKGNIFLKVVYSMS
ncbi:hypothetical protein A2U01_0024630, partial [Trifolium medium]|nr:hypothetical protein [Trifolium medium]